MHWREAGLQQNFQILDADDQLRLVKRVMRSLDLDEQKWPARQAVWFINSQKDEGRRAREVATNDDQLLEKVHSNLQEVKARGGQLYVFADPASGFREGPGVTVIVLPEVHRLLAPIVYVVPLQLLAYHVAVLKGTDVDQPRNLAKSVTVE